MCLCNWATDGVAPWWMHFCSMWDLSLRAVLGKVFYKNMSLWSIVDMPPNFMLSKFVDFGHVSNCELSLLQLGSHAKLNQILFEIQVEVPSWPYSIFMLSSLQIHYKNSAMLPIYDVDIEYMHWEWWLFSYSELSKIS